MSIARRAALAASVAVLVCIGLFALAACDGGRVSADIRSYGSNALNAAQSYAAGTMSSEKAYKTVQDNYKKMDAYKGSSKPDDTYVKTYTSSLATNLYIDASRGLSYSTSANKDDIDDSISHLRELL